MARKYSSEYKNLQPYVVEDIRKVVNAVGAAGGTGSGSLEVHALSGAYHSGELAQTQASWAATKVELSNHAALPDVHHARAHSIISSSDHTVTGSQYQIVGLTSTNTLGLLTAASSPTTNQVVKTDGSSAVTLVDLTVSSDLFMTGTLDFGTDTMYEDATYLQVAGSKAVKFNQNIGNAAWTIYNAGGASFGGNVDIVSGGDLTVAGSGSYAGNTVLFADSSGGNVGIMRTPDSQFALDIAGPARAEYWIGPHAIQLKNVLLLAHYDGRAPYETNYTGEPNGHMGQVATVAGGLIFRPGKFYKALQCSYATTNLITNPSFETNTTGWATDYAGVTTITNAPGGVYGSAQVTVSASGTPSNFYSPSVSVTNSTSYVVSFWYKSTGSITVAVREYGRATNLSSESLTAVTEWTRYTKSVTTLSSGSTNIRILFTFTNGAAIELDAVQVETGTIATPYCDGSLGGYSAAGVPDGTGHSWSGTAHASTSSRTHATLRYPVAGNISATKGTIMLWVYADAWNANSGFLWQAGNANGEFDAYVNSGGTPIFRINSTSLTSSTGALAVKTWHHIAYTWDIAANERVIYVNGVSGGSTTTGVAPTLDTVIAVGNTNQAAATFNHLGYIDDFCILDRVLPADEIRSVYESNAPVFAETSTFVFRPTPKGLIWADDEGLWMRDSTGKPVLGIYGGETYKAGWGGFDLYPGDLLIGNNAASSSAIFWDQSAGKFGFYGNANSTAQVEIATDGSLTAGAGALALNSGGIVITAPSSQANTGAYRFAVTGKTISGGLYSYYNSGSGTYYSFLMSDSSDISNITTGIGATIGGGGTSKILFTVTNSQNSASTEYVVSGSNTYWWFGSAYMGVGTAAAPTRPLQVNGGIFAGGESTGLAGYVQLTNSTQGVSSGVGTVKLNGTTARDSVGWLKLFSGTTAIYVPYWTTVTG